MTQNYTLMIRRGEDYRRSVPVLGDDVESLAGWTATAQIRAQPASTTVLHTWTIGDGITVDGTNLILEVDAATSTAWTFARGYYDLRVVDPAGRATVLLEGRVIVAPTVTR